MKEKNTAIMKTERTNRNYVVYKKPKPHLPKTQLLNLKTTVEGLASNFIWEWLHIVNKDPTQDDCPRNFSCGLELHLSASNDLCKETDIGGILFFKNNKIRPAAWKTESEQHRSLKN